VSTDPALDPRQVEYWHAREDEQYADLTDGQLAASIDRYAAMIEQSARFSGEGTTLARMTLGAARRVLARRRARAAGVTPVRQEETTVTTSETDRPTPRFGPDDCPRCGGRDGFHTRRGCADSTCNPSEHPDLTCDEYDESLAADHCTCATTDNPPCGWCEADHETKMSWPGR